MSDATLVWDFFGPRAEPTALHFQRHLNEFLTRNEIIGCTTGTRSEGRGHCAAYCVAPAASRDAIARALRPQRVIEAANS
jgi:hypothetical protein